MQFGAHSPEQSHDSGCDSQQRCRRMPKLGSFNLPASIQFQADLTNRQSARSKSMIFPKFEPIPKAQANAQSLDSSQRKLGHSLNFGLSDAPYFDFLLHFWREFYQCSGKWALTISYIIKYENCTCKVDYFNQAILFNLIKTI